MALDSLSGHRAPRAAPVGERVRLVQVPGVRRRGAIQRRSVLAAADRRGGLSRGDSVLRVAGRHPATTEDPLNCCIRPVEGRMEIGRRQFGDSAERIRRPSGEGCRSCWGEWNRQTTPQAATLWTGSTMNSRTTPQSSASDGHDHRVAADHVGATPRFKTVVALIAPGEPHREGRSGDTASRRDRDVGSRRPWRGSRVGRLKLSGRSTGLPSMRPVPDWPAGKALATSAESRGNCHF